MKLARNKGKTILPVYMEGDIPESLRGYQMLDMSGWQVDKDEMQSKLDEMLEKAGLNQYAG